MTQGVVQDNKINVEDTRLRGDFISTPKKMVTALGLAAKDGDPKTTLEWRFRDSNGMRWTVYDYKLIRHMRPEAIRTSSAPTVFNIGGEEESDPTEFREFLKTKLNPELLNLKTAAQRRADDLRMLAEMDRKANGDGCCSVNFFLKIAVFVAVIAAAVQLFVWPGIDLALDISRPMPALTHPPLTCTHVPGPLGAEDMVVWDGTPLTSELDALRTFNHALPPRASDPAGSVTRWGIWAIEPAAVGSSTARGGNASGYTARKLELNGLPNGVGFHSHGLAVRGNTLFVVNHAMDGVYGDRIEEFALSRDSEGRVTLTFSRAHLGGADARFTTQMSGGINAVAPINDAGDFYATQWIPWNNPRDGYRRGLLAELKQISYFLLGGALQIKRSRIWHCKGNNGECRPVGDRATMWNGIDLIPAAPGSDGLGRVVAVDMANRDLAVFSAQPNGDLVLERRISVDGMIDNVRWVPELGRLWAGGMANTKQCYFGWLGQHKDGKIEPKGGGGAPISGELCPGHAISVDVDAPDGDVRYEAVYSGERLAGVSAALPVSGTTSFVMGSFVDAGLVVCDRRKD